MDLRHLVHEMMPKQDIAAPTNHRSEDARSIGMLEMAQPCSATRMRRPSQQRAILRRAWKVTRQAALSRANIPHTGDKRRVAQQPTHQRKRRGAGAECKAHRGITTGNAHWANLLSFLTNTTKQHTMNIPRIHLSDLPTTWAEYQMFREISQHPHNAFIAAVIADEKTRLLHDDGVTTSNPKMLREDPVPNLSNCLPSIISNLQSKQQRGYQLPFGATFDPEDHKFGVSSLWTVAETENVIEFAEQIWNDSSACLDALTAQEENETKCLIREGLPKLDFVIARMMCAQATGVAGALVEALRKVRAYKVSFGDLIISSGLNVPINGELFQLYEFGGVYVYINQNGDESIPF